MCNYGILRAIFPNQEETPLLVNYGTRRGSFVVRRRRYCVGGPDMKMKWGHSVGKTRILSEICMFRMEFSIICDPKICKIAIHHLQLGLHFALFPGLFISRHVMSSMKRCVHVVSSRHESTKSRKVKLIIWAYLGKG